MTTTHKEVTIDQFSEMFEEALSISAAESGADREMCFDLEAYHEEQYNKYIELNGMPALHTAYNRYVKSVCTIMNDLDVSGNVAHMSTLETLDDAEFLCHKCNGYMREGKALHEGWSSGITDFIGQTDDRGQTLSPSGKSSLVAVMKCIDCGHSFTL